MKRNLLELWRYRALIVALVSRHLRARYRGSILGFVWSFLNPLCLIAVYSLVFRYYIRYDTVHHYTLFLFTGLLPWIWFSSALLESTASISNGGHLITKAMFPPHVLPVVSVLTNLMNFLFAVPLLFGYMFIEGVSPEVGLLALPVVIVIECVFVLGLALLFAAINVHFRDTQHILGNILTLLFFLCPILYPVTSVPEKFRFTLASNPVAMFTLMYQQMFIEGRFPDATLLLLATAIAMLTFLIGNVVFNAYRDEFAELV